MRDLRTRLTRSRRARRVALAIMVLTASPVMADHPQGHTLRMMPPLPLQAISSNTIRSNPFCEPENLSGGGAIRLTSGSRAIRLKPVNGTVGSHAIREADSRAPTVIVEPGIAPSIRNNPLVASTHHDNEDLVETEVLAPGEKPQATPSAAAPSIQASGPAQVSRPASGNSTIVLVPPSIDVHPAEANPAVAITQKHVSSADQPNPLPEPVRPAVRVASTQDIESAPDAPIIFSLSDRAETSDDSEPLATVATPDLEEPGNDAESGPHELKPTQSSIDEEGSHDNVDDGGDLPMPLSLPTFGALPMPHLMAETMEAGKADETPVITELEAMHSDERIATEVPSESLQPVVITANELHSLDTLKSHHETEPDPTTPDGMDQEPTIAASRKPKNAQAEETADITVVKPTILDRSTRTIRVAESPARSTPTPVAIYRSGAANRPLGSPQESSLHDQRFRPPVSVTPVPVGIIRKEAEFTSTETQASVEPVERVTLANPKPAASTKPLVAPDVKLTPLFMKSAQVRSLTVAGDLCDVRIGDKSVCQAIASGPNHLKLIGTGSGVTQLVVWAKTDDLQHPMRMRAFEIHVDRVDPAVENGGRTSVMLNQSIRDAFPRCGVTLSQQGGELIVSGQCDSEASAEKIIRMIRKTCLVPVQDRLVVR